MSKTSKPSFGTMAKIARENFAVLSSVSVVFGITTAALFTTGYLSVFNSGLIWLIDYADLIKVGIIAAVFFLGLIYVYDGLISGVFESFNTSAGKGARIANAVAIAGILALWIWGNIYRNWNNHPKLFQNIAILTAVALAITCAFKFNRVKARGFQDISDAITAAGMVAFLMTTCGVVYGYHVRNSVNLRQTIFLDDHAIYNAAVVLMTDKFAVFSQEDGSVVVYPSARVREIISQSGT